MSPKSDFEYAKVQNIIALWSCTYLCAKVMGIPREFLADRNLPQEKSWFVFLKLEEVSASLQK